MQFLLRFKAFEQHLVLSLLITNFFQGGKAQRKRKKPCEGGERRVWFSEEARSEHEEQEQQGGDLERRHRVHQRTQAGARRGHRGLQEFYF